MPRKIIWVSVIAIFPQLVCVGMIANDLKSGDSLGLALVRGWWIAGFGWALIALIPFLITRQEIARQEKVHREVSSHIYVVLMFHAFCMFGGISLLFLPCFKAS